MSIHRNMKVTEIMKRIPGSEKMTLAELLEIVRRYESGGGGMSDGMTLTEFYEKVYLPEVSRPKGVKRLTLREREVSLKYWEEITGRIAIGDVTKQTLCLYVEKLREKKLRPATIRKHCCALRPCRRLLPLMEKSAMMNGSMLPLRSAGFLRKQN